ncbi:peptidoglycan editing factor PgeF [Arthrobacter sp. MSA 4-2]|uniref:peptidoglycan editing factor PgeF n=1 Tax=Arthrobacter sp. MSA 4-2 TaxID=2794349 RepID=UPI0018E8F0F7|nr:peptidoglycan editing factor PgeF [Arthrobacter sp. MSA 4-2]MBJ2122141.1 peptidoglycan editing factor PgeF [Arthrobacter sp. MSA 4-2]
MFFWQGGVQPGLHAAFTDSAAGNLALNLGRPSTAAGNRARVETAMGVAPGSLRFMTQVHSSTVAEVPAGSPRWSPPEADALLSPDGSQALAVLVADCVPVVLADRSGPATGVVHAGRRGVLTGIVPNAVAGLRAHGARELTAWIGPSVCGRCYEVPAEMREEVAAAVPASYAQTRHGTPALDLPAAVRQQLLDAGVDVAAVPSGSSACTLENPRLFSHRREPGAGRLAGLVWRT